MRVKSKAVVSESALSDLIMNLLACNEAALATICLNTDHHDGFCWKQMGGRLFLQVFSVFSYLITADGTAQTAQF